VVTIGGGSFGPCSAFSIAGRVKPHPRDLARSAAFFRHSAARGQAGSFFFLGSGAITAAKLTRRWQADASLEGLSAAAIDVVRTCPTEASLPEWIL